VTSDPVTLVARVRALGITIRADGGTLVLAPRGVVPPGLRAELVAAKPAVLAVLRAASAPPAAPTAALRAAYRRWFILTVAEAAGVPIDRLEAQALHQQIVRLTDEAGVLWADAVYADELRRFRWDTARCGACGGLGHDTPHGPKDDLKG
jgi:tubulysin polyketide synthase-like protein